MATQADVDALTAEIGTVETDLGTLASDLSTATSEIQAEIDALASGNPALDLTGLKAAADKLDPAVQAADAAAKALGNLKPAPPAPAA